MLDFRSRRFEDKTAPQSALKSGRRGKSRDKDPASTGRSIGKPVRSPIVTKVIVSVYRNSDSADAFLFDRAKKIAWISSPVQTWFGYSGCVESALGREAGFFRGVVKGADDEVFAVAALRAPAEFCVFVSKTPHNFGPRDIRSNRGHDRNRTCQNKPDY